MATVNRPLSPHLQVYRPQITSVLSILHRITGVALGVGSLWLACWLTLAASDAAGFAAMQAFTGSILGRLLLLGFTWALFYHLCNGVRHLFWDAGWGFDLAMVTKTGWASVGGATALTLAAWIVGYAARG